MPLAEVQTHAIERLHEFSSRIFMHFGVPRDDAQLAADVLATADLRGVDSHGIARLRTYFDMLSLGRINPKANVRVIRELPGTATVDGDNGLGLVIGPKANVIAMEKALEVGSGWVSVRNSNHFGLAGYYPLEALKRGLIGWAMTNSTKLVAPLWGAERMLGTNPIAIAFPGLDEPPIVIDMATIASPIALFVILLAWLATSWYILDAVQRLLFGQQRQDLPFKDLQQSEFAALLMVVLIVIALGVIPSGLLGPDSFSPLTSAITGSFAWNR